MAFPGGLGSIDAFADEPYYCSAIWNPGDIVCEGSDAEESEEQTIKKRRRYEYYAKRYRDGHLPVLQSASLRGPLDTETGWINPWRYRRQADQNWWRPDSQDMLFTRANVMKMAAENSLGYLSPVDALAWCKATALAETEPTNNIRDLETEMGIDASCRNELSSGKLGQMNLRYVSKGKGAVSDDPNSGKTNLAHDPSMTSSRQFTATPNNDSLDVSSREMQRPSESNWLKGASLSENARWEQSQHLSPTPFRSGQVRNGVRSKRTDLKSRISYTERSRFLASRNSDSRHMELQQDSSGVVGIAHQSKDISADVTKSSRSIERDSMSLDEGWPNSISNRRSSKDATQPYSSHSNLPASRIPYNHSQQITDGSPKNHHDPVNRSCSVSSSNEVHKTSSLPPAQDTATSETGFITQIAPSSGALERFQYRKKRGPTGVLDTRSRPRFNRSIENLLSASPKLRLTAHQHNDASSSSGRELGGGIYELQGVSRVADQMVAEFTPGGRSSPESGQPLQSDRSQGIVQPLACSIARTKGVVHTTQELENTVSMPVMDHSMNAAELFIESLTSRIPSSPRSSSLQELKGSSQKLSASIRRHAHELDATEMSSRTMFKKAIVEKADGFLALDLVSPPAQTAQITTAVMMKPATQEISREGIDDASPMATNLAALGTQSPWMPLNLSVFPISAESNEFVHPSTNAFEARKPLAQDLELPEEETRWKDEDLQTIEKPSTPSNDNIMSFKELLSPLPSMRPRSSSTSADDLLDTQVLIDAATKNPWAEKPTPGSRIKRMKRVSFGGIFLVEGGESLLKPSDRSLRSPPPPSRLDLDFSEDRSPNTRGRVVQLKQRFSETGSFKLTSQREHETPTRSSPDIGAMAEAFIQADREAVLDTRHRSSAARSPSRHLKTLNDAEANMGKDSTTAKGTSNPGSPVGKARTAKADHCEEEDNVNYMFDDVLGDVLEEWSVDKALETVMPPRNATGHRRSAVRPT